MASAPQPVFCVQVRELVEFVWRRGDLGGTGDFVGRNRALAGTRGHQRLQRTRPKGYQKEVRLSFDVPGQHFVLRIQGRIDGVLAQPAPARESGTASPSPHAATALIEEIKTVQGAWDGQADPLHWAQAKIYAFIYAETNDLTSVAVQLTYLNLDTGAVAELQEQLSRMQLAQFFQETTAVYQEWLATQQEWLGRRNASIEQLGFPFSSYRPGQRNLAVAAYRILARGGRLFLEAPTGIGKTVSVLFPAIKALGEGKLERIFYFTARTLGRTVAQKAITDLRQAGLRLRAVTLTAKEKICFQPEQCCDVANCPYAKGYYDRQKAAMREALAREEITREALEDVARRHEVCPFELSLDVSTWADVVVCDYNYLFDPRAYLRRHFADEPADYAFLIDEAHNLVDRAREMFSADLDTGEIQQVRRALKKSLPACARALTRLSSALRKACTQAPENAATAQAESIAESDTETALHPELFPAANPAHPLSSGSGPQTSRQLPEALLAPLDKALAEAEGWLARNEPSEFRDSLRDLFFRLLTFQRTAQLFDEHYVTIAEPGRFTRVRLFCLDPSFLLAQALARGKAAVLFSATLTPIDYYRALLGGEEQDQFLQLPSPFPPEHLAVLVQDRIRTHLKARAETLADVAEAVRALVQGRPGNYLVYFPSYAYLAATLERFQALEPKIQTLVQRPGMSEPERDEFLATFAVEHGRTLVGFAVMGGIFAEGIDLVGERLIGAVIVGVGLPQLCVERDLIRDYFRERGRSGFDYAYTFPGMNRVLQATGRVIRSETDRGVILLIDQRFGEPRYRRLFPPTWRPAIARHRGRIDDLVRDFWQGGSAGGSLPRQQSPRPTWTLAARENPALH